MAIRYEDDNRPPAVQLEPGDEQVRNTCKALAEALFGSPALVVEVLDDSELMAPRFRAVAVKGDWDESAIQGEGDAPRDALRALESVLRSQLAAR